MSFVDMMDRVIIFFFFISCIHAFRKSDFPSGYEIISTLGKGFEGETFQARNKSDGVMYCMKVFRKRSTEAFDNEAAVVSILPVHVSLMKYYKAETHNHTHFIISEFINGTRLLNHLPSRNVTFNETRVLLWTEQIFDGLAHLHSAIPRIVHYDITLSNVMVTNKNSIKIIDVGDCVIGENKVKHQQYANAYSSPERYWFQHQTSTWRQQNPSLIKKYETLFLEKDDIWATAIMISELVTGKRVTSTNSRLGTGRQGVNTPVNTVLLNRMISEVFIKSKKLGTIVQNILSHRSPKNRPSANDILQSYRFQ